MNKIYPFQLWLTSVLVIAPIIIIVANLINSRNIEELGVLPLFIAFGIFFSLPVLLICYFTYRLLIKRTSSALLIKIIINTITIIGVFTTFYVISGSMALILSLVYSGSVVISSLLFKIKEREKALPIT
jgi:Sec-independent protein secretion pathway component TatC